MTKNELERIKRVEAKIDILAKMMADIADRLELIEELKLETQNSNLTFKLAKQTERSE